MYLNTNMSALETIQSLATTMTQENSSIQQLSTGNRITSAASDPAGLAISELMQGQISGLNQASQNSQNAMSLLQTADGALSNIDTILQSMRSLASEAATGTNNQSDLQDLQQEMNQYAKEITSITNTTQFNNINLLSGNFQNQTVQIGANQGQSLGISVGAMDAYTLGVTGLAATISGTNGAQVNSGTLQLGAGLQPGSNYEIQLVSSQSASVSTISQSADFGTAATTEVTGSFQSGATTTFTITVSTNSSGSFIYNVAGSDGFTYSSTASSVALTVLTFTDTISGATLTFKPASSTTVAAGDTAVFTLTPETATFNLANSSGTVLAGASAVTLTGNQQMIGTITVGNTSSGQNATGAVVSFQLNNASTNLPTALATIGSTAVAATNTTIDVTSNGQAATGVPGALLQPSQYAVANSGLNITTQASAEAALSVVDNAIQTVDNQRADIGAKINRLTFAQTNAQTESTNLQAANAGYLNANMPALTAQFMQQQVLVQADVGLLAQANQLPAALLKLIP